MGIVAPWHGGWRRGGQPSIVQSVAWGIDLAFESSQPWVVVETTAGVDDSGWKKNHTFPMLDN